MSPPIISISDHLVLILLIIVFYLESAMGVGVDLTATFSDCLQVQTMYPFFKTFFACCHHKK